MKPERERERQIGKYNRFNSKQIDWIINDGIILDNNDDLGDNRMYFHLCLQPYDDSDDCCHYYCLDNL